MGQGEPVPFGDLFALHLRQGAQDGQHQQSGGRSGVELLRQAHQLHAVRLEHVLHQLEEVAGAAGESIEPIDHDRADLARPDPREEHLELRAVETLATLASLHQDLGEREAESAQAAVMRPRWASRLRPSRACSSVDTLVSRSLLGGAR